MTGHTISAASHYETQSLDWIKSLPVKDLAAKDCVLFMWAVSPLLPEAFEVIEAWGFKYKTVAFCLSKIGRTCLLGRRSKLVYTLYTATHQRAVNKKLNLITEDEYIAIDKKNKKYFNYLNYEESA